jgi:hypothetical protein
VSTLDALVRAVAEFPVAGLELSLDPAALAVARGSLDEAGFLLLGEVHGVWQNPQVIRELVRALELTSVALEWPNHLDSEVWAFLRDDGPPRDDPWLWAGDGRITAGHFAVLRDLIEVEPLTLTLFDVPIAAGGTWSDRDAGMAAHLLDSPAADSPTLVVAGNAHTPLTRTRLGIPLGARLARHRPAVREIRIRYRSGRFYNFRSRRLSFRRRAAAPARLTLEHDTPVVVIPSAHEAVVPHRR